jgi:hypothetical protein
MYPRKVDVNHAAIVSALRAAGWNVRSTAMVGNGFADLVAAKSGLNVLVECKRDFKAKLTADQSTFHMSWPGPLVVVTSPEDAVAQLQCLYSKSTGRVLQISGEAA